jgi:hypothetical protein
VRAVVPATYQHWVDKAEKGSFKAAVALKCLDCCCFQRAEVAACPVRECSLWHLRPYGRRNSELAPPSRLELGD